MGIINMKKTLGILVFLLAIFPLFSQIAGANNTNIAYYGIEWFVTNAKPTETQHFWGDGSWEAAGNNNGVSDDQFSVSVRLADIYGGYIPLNKVKSIEFNTLKNSLQNNQNFVLDLSISNSAGYARDLILEPKYSRNFSDNLGSWVTWSTNSGVNQLTAYDYAFGPSENCTLPTLQDLQAGPVSWSNETIDYSQNSIVMATLSADNPWADTFNGYIDGIKIILNDDSVITVDFEAPDNDRTAQITAPLSETKISESLILGATLTDDDSDDTAVWYIRKGTCAEGGDIIAGNVGDFTNVYNWSSNIFSATLDIDSWSLGNYCFIFDPREDADERSLSVSQDFKIVEDAVVLPTVPAMLGFKNPNVLCGGITNSYMVTVDWSDSIASSGIAGYDYSIDYPKTDGTRGTWGKFVTISELTGHLGEGVHYIKVRAKDNKGNYSDWSNVCKITGDRTVPTVKITSPDYEARVSGKVEIKGSIADNNLSSYSVVVTNNKNEKVAASGEISQTSNLYKSVLWNWNSAKTANGLYTIRLQAKDAAGNVSSTSTKVYLRSSCLSSGSCNLPVLITKDQCKKCGWKKFSYLGFKNQGQCVSYVERMNKK